jgi:hypothetical protein
MVGERPRKAEAKIALGALVPGDVEAPSELSCESIEDRVDDIVFAGRVCFASIPKTGGDPVGKARPTLGGSLRQSPPRAAERIRLTRSS